jgi:DNA-binding MarR family transcriptional regulator
MVASSLTGYGITQAKLPPPDARRAEADPGQVPHRVDGDLVVSCAMAGGKMLACDNQLEDAGLVRALPDTGATADELATAFVRLIRQLKSRHGADPAMACLGVASRLGPVRISTLADELLLDISTASRHVRNLESARLLSREPDPADLRATLLTVTPQGLEYLRQGMARRAQTLRAATATWPESDLTTLTTLINRLADDLGAVVESKEGS